MIRRRKPQSKQLHGFSTGLFSAVKEVWIALLAWLVPPQNLWVSTQEVVLRNLIKGDYPLVFEWKYWDHSYVDLVGHGH